MVKSYAGATTGLQQRKPYGRRVAAMGDVQRSSACGGVGRQVDMVARNIRLLEHTRGGVSEHDEEDYEGAVR